MIASKLPRWCPLMVANVNQGTREVSVPPSHAHYQDTCSRSKRTTHDASKGITVQYYSTIILTYLFDLLGHPSKATSLLQAHSHGPKLFSCRTFRRLPLVWVCLTLGGCSPFSCPGKKRVVGSPFSRLSSSFNFAVLMHFVTLAVCSCCCTRLHAN